MPFLRANDVEPRIVLPSAARWPISTKPNATGWNANGRLHARTLPNARKRHIKRERALLEAEQGVFVEREDRVFLAVVLLLVAPDWDSGRWPCGG